MRCHSILGLAALQFSQLCARPMSSHELEITTLLHRSLASFHRPHANRWEVGLS